MLGEGDRAREAPEIVALAMASSAPASGKKKEQGGRRTPSMSHCAATLSRIGEKLSKRFRPAQIVLASIFSMLAMNWSCWRSVLATRRILRSLERR